MFEVYFSLMLILFEPRRLPWNPPDCTILNKWVVDNLILVDKRFAKTLQRFVTFLLVNNNLRRKLVSSSELPIIFDDSLKTTPILFLIAYINLLSCESDRFTFELLYWVVLCWYFITQN